MTKTARGALFLAAILMGTASLCFGARAEEGAALVETTESVAFEPGVIFQAHVVKPAVQFLSAEQGGRYVSMIDAGIPAGLAWMLALADR